MFKKQVNLPVDLIISIIALNGCSSTQQFLSSPQGQAILAGVEKTAATAAVSAID
jgi:hypothetical protein